MMVRGEVLDSDFAWHEGMAQWESAATVLQALGIAPGGGAAPPPGAATFGGQSSQYRKSWRLPVFFLFILGGPVLLLSDKFSDNPHLGLAVISTLAWLSPLLLSIADRLTYQLTVYERGLIVRSMLGTKSIPFDGQTMIRQQLLRESLNGIPTGASTTIFLSHGRKRVTLRASIKDIEHLRRELMEEVEVPIIAPAVLQAYASGKTVDFGRASLGNGYLKVRSKQLKTTMIQTMEMSQGVLTIRQKTDNRLFCRLQTQDIGNLNIFLHLLQQTSKLGKPTVQNI